MAMNYQNFASLGVNLNRQKYGPLDISNVFTSAADLKYYLTKGAFTQGVSEYWYKNANEKIVPYPYEGQVLATVIDGVVEVFVLALDEAGNFETREIAGKIEVDGTTIVKDAEGKLSIVAPVDPDDKKTYNFSYANGVYSWVEVDTATAAGQAQAIQGLTDRTVALEEAVNGKGEGEAHVAGLVEKVAALEAVDNATQAELDAYKEIVTAAIAAGVKEAKDYADANDADTIYDDTDVKADIKELQGVVGDAEGGLVKAVADNTAAISAGVTEAKGYADAAIEGLEVAIEQKDGVEHIVIKNKDGKEVASVNASKFVQDSFLDDVAYDPQTRKITFTWTMGDGSTKTDEVNIADLVDTYSAGEGLTLTGNEFAVDFTKVASVEALEELAGQAQTAEEVGAAIDAKITAANLGQYAIKTEVNTKFEDYYTKQEVEDKGYAVDAEVAETYATKAELEEAVEGIENDLLAYAKTEDVNKELAKKIESGSIAHSSESLAEGVTVEGTKLNIVVDAYTKQEVRDYVADVIEDMTGGESAADVKLLLENHIETYTEKVGQIDAKDSAQDTAIAKAQEDATKGIADAKTANDAIAALTSGAVAENAREIAAVKGTITTVNETLSGKITTLETKDIELAGLISGLDTAVKGNASTIGQHTAAISALEAKDEELAGQISGVDAKFANYYNKTEVDTKVQEAIDAIPEVDFTPYAKVADVNSALALKADAASVYTKEEANAAFMNQDEVDARINALIVGADPEGGKAITDIQNLVKYVDENAGEIAALITATDANTAKLAGIDGTVKGAIETAIAAIVMPKASEEVTLAEDGTLGLGKVSTDKLEMGDLELILDGGSSAV